MKITLTEAILFKFKNVGHTRRMSVIELYIFKENVLELS